jgi:anion-transporting  ArsA/GET3 family ATPase
VTEPLDRLLARRILVVTGKGGTGKTSIAAALALLATRRGIDTVLVETGEAAGLLELVAPEGRETAPGDGREPVPLRPHLFFLRIDPTVALREYLELQLRLRALVALLVHNPGFQALLGAAPGWRELITLGKLWHLQRSAERGRRRFGLLVVDAPATGHGLSFLSIPSVVADTVRVGPLRRQASDVWELFSDPERTLVVPVTLAEELPVRETLELRARIEELGLATGPTIANGLEPLPELPDRDALYDLLDTLCDPPSPLCEPRALRAALTHATTRADLQRAFLATLERGLGAPALPLPYLTEGIAGPEQVERLADELERAFGGGV